jgi:hypothetical protein
VKEADANPDGCAPVLPVHGRHRNHIHEVGPRLVARDHGVDVLTTDPTGELAPEERVVRVCRPGRRSSTSTWRPPSTA